MGYIGAGLTRFNTADELTVTGDAEFDGNLTVKGTHITLDSATVQTVDLGDNDKIRLGDGDDLQIYHDGSNSIINEAGTGSLKFQYGGTDGVVFDSSGNVGIGTGSITSGFKLEVTGDARFGDAYNDDAVELGWSSGGSQGFVQAYDRGASAFRDLSLNNSMTITSTSNVGIGGSETTVFNGVGGDMKFVVIGNDSTTTVGNNSDAGIAIVNTNQTAGNLAGLHFARADTDDTPNYAGASIVAQFPEAQVTGQYPKGDLAFLTSTATNSAPSEKMRITSSGNVGIGTATPIALLTMVAADGVMTDQYVAKFTNSETTAGQNYGVFIAGGSSSADESFGVRNFDSSATYFKVRGDGNVGIGTSNVTSPFVVNTSFDSGYLSQFVNTGTGSDPNGVLIQAGVVDSAYVLRLQKQNASDVLVVRGSGNVGIGITSPSELLHVKNASGDAAVRIQGNTRTFNIQQNNYGLRFVDVDAGSVERMRLDASGNVLVGTSSSSFSSGGTSYTPKFAVDAGGTNIAYFKSSGAGAGVIVNNVYGSGTRYLISFDTATARVGDITTNGTSTTYGTTSDYRLKENVTDITDATTRLKQLNPVRFNFIADADTTVDGFLAHEVQDIVPEAITGTKDGMRDEEYEVSAATGDIYTPAVEATYDEDGVELTAAIDEVIHSADVERPEELAEGQQWRETTAAVMGTRSVPDYQGIDQSKLVPLLVKTIQELEARIAALETA